MKKYLYLLLAAAILLPNVSYAAPLKTLKPKGFARDLKVTLTYDAGQFQTSEFGITSYIPFHHMFPLAHEGQSHADNQVVEITRLYLKPSIYKGTNLESAIFLLSADFAITSADECYDASTTEKQISLTKKRKVMGNSWHYTSPHPGGGAAAGHSSYTELYRLFKNNTCYEVVLGTSDFNRSGLDNPNSIKEYNFKKVMSRLGAVFNRLQIK